MPETLYEVIDGQTVAIPEERAAAIRAAWEAAANAPAPVPQSVTPRQARTALHAAGLLSAVNAAVAAAGEQAQIDWDYALEIRRDDPTIAALAVELNLTSEQIDDLFRAAAQVT